MDINEILTCLGLEEFKEVFSDNDIDYEAALLLGHEELKELIPKIGPRIKLKRYLEKLKSPSPVCNPNSPVEDNTSQSEVTFNTKDVTEAGSTSSRETFGSSTNSESLDGRAIVKEGQKTGLLTESSRRKLSQLLIHHRLQNNVAKSISKEEFLKIATEIVELFDKEHIGIYFSPYEAASNSKCKKKAGGKLYETYITRRRKLRECGDLPGTSRSSSKSSRSTLTITEDDIDALESDDYANEETLLWLKNHVDPWKDVEHKWEEIADHRLKLIQSGSGEIADYFKDFPALQRPEGYTLLLADFSRLYPDKENSLLSTISLTKEEIVKYAKEKLQKIRDKDVKSKIKEIIGVIKDDDNGTYTNVALMLLAYVINISPVRKQKGKPTWKPSRAEICDGYIMQAASEAEVTSKLIAKRENLQSLCRTVQPFVIYVGPSVAEVKTAYVVINETLYRFTKLISAVDCAFKVFHTTGASYPEEAADIWLFLQLGCYKIKTIYDRPTQAVHTLLSDLMLTA